MMMMLISAKVATRAVDWATFNNDVDDNDNDDVDNLNDDVDDE